MSNNKKGDLFEADRRNQNRDDDSDRRLFLRPTKKLKLLGSLGAALVFFAVVIIYYLFLRT